MGGMANVAVGQPMDTVKVPWHLLNLPTIQFIHCSFAGHFLLEHHDDKLDCNSMFLVKLQRSSTNLAGENPDVPSLVQGNLALLYHYSFQGRGKNNYNY